MDDVNINMDEEEFEVLSDDSDDLPSSSNKAVNKTSKINEEEFDVLSDASNDLPPSSKAVNKTISKINNPPAKKYQRIPKPLPFNPGFLSNPKNYPCIAIEDEVILKDGAGPEFSIGEAYEAAVSIRTMEKESKLYYLKEFTLDQMRDITKTMAVPNFSKLNTFQSRHAIASLVLRTQALLKKPELAQLRPPDIATKLRYNTIVRMINVLFSEKYLQTYLESNNNKTRADIEIGVGGTMDRFWTHLSKEMTNSAVQGNNKDNNDDDNSGVQVDNNTVDPYKLIFAESIDDVKFQERVDETDLNPSDFTVTTGTVLSAWEKDLRRVRQVVIENMTTSGTHESDI